MTTLITGGAGYIGSHVVRMLSEAGERIHVIDDLVTGDRRRIPGIDTTVLELSDPRAVEVIAGVCSDKSVDQVVHFAARKQVVESVARPAWYFQQNVGGLANLLLGMEQSGVRSLVFSSSAAVYGTTVGGAIRETDPTVPINPYGVTKLVGEQLVASASHAFGLRAVSLRYFNVAGAGRPELGDRAILNLVPMVFERIDRGQSPLVFGDDYDTVDGTCIRDYVHVDDLARAHVGALRHLVSMPPGHETFNVGTGRGTSVREMIDLILAVAHSELAPEIRPRRFGDPSCVVASPAEIEAAFGWRSRMGLEDIVQSAWASHTMFHGR